MAAQRLIGSSDEHLPSAAGVSHRAAQTGFRLDGVVIATVIAAAMAVVSQTAAAAAPRTTVFNDIVVNERVDGDVIAFEADVHLGPMAAVTGDVVVIGGDVRLDDHSTVGSHVVAVFGTVDAAPRAVIDGETLAFSSLSGIALNPDEHTELQVDLAVRLLTSGGWLMITTALAFGLATRLRFGVWMLPRLGLRVVVLGVAAAVTFFAAVVAFLGMGPSIGVPLAISTTVLFFGLRAVGLTVVGGWAGHALLRRIHQRPFPLTIEVFVGVIGLLVLRFVPWVGGGLWSIVAVAALGTGIIVLATPLTRPRALVGGG